ncbi:baseplate protein [Pararheinheimera phage vB_PsoM_KLER1-1]|nr:baseplate protein [Pararheinheimera phage vB_PsoM_KLER1-1]
MMETRNTQIQIFYNDVDISADISDSLISFEFTDNAGDKADDISIVLEDKRRLWRNEWFPSKGATLKAFIIPSKGPALPCGTFQIDKVRCNLSPAQVTIGGVSVPVDKPIRTEKKTRTWEGTDLQKIGNEVATAAGVEFGWYGTDIRKYNRIDQTEESDLTFLNRLCREVNHKVKVSDGRLIVFDDTEFSKRAASFSVDVENSTVVLGGDFDTESSNIYKAARLRYHDPVTKIDIDYTAEADESVVSREVLELNKRVETIDQAITIAERELERANKMEVTGSLDLIGTSSASAGLVMAVTNAGRFSGRYMIDTARHSYNDSSGWTVNVAIHRVK